MAQIKFGSAAKSRRKRDRKKVEIRKKEFQFHGKTIEELQKLTVEELLPMLPSRSRRTLKRGLSKDENKLMEDVKKAKQGDLIKTHCRNMIVLPSFVGFNILIHNGKDFERVSIQPQMIGHYLGEFAMTRKRVSHSAPGIGATKSSSNIAAK